MLFDSTKTTDVIIIFLLLKACEWNETSELAVVYRLNLKIIFKKFKMLLWDFRSPTSGVFPAKIEFLEFLYFT
jgi:hypothetical protein